MQVGDRTIQFYAISEQAISISFGDGIDMATNQRVMQCYRHLQRGSFDGFIEAIPAYATLTVIYNPLLVKKQTPAGKTVAEQVEEWLRDHIPGEEEPAGVPARMHHIPVCYDAAFAPDLAGIAQHRNISTEEVTARHSAPVYHVFMMGFLPGFAYLGIVDPVIAMPRLGAPRPAVPPGSVGIAGQQTGIYPLSSPGGWQLIGRCPVRLFDATASDPFLLKAGDCVQFHAISKKEFEQYNPLRS